MKFNLLHNLTSEYQLRVALVGLTGRAAANSHFVHLTTNILGRMEMSQGLYHLIPMPPKQEERKRNYIESIRALREYLALLQRSEAFRKSELSLERGHFPDMFLKSGSSHNGSSAINYIYQAKERIHRYPPSQ